MRKWTLGRGAPRLNRSLQNRVVLYNKPVDVHELLHGGPDNQLFDSSLIRLKAHIRVYKTFIRRKHQQFP